MCGAGRGGAEVGAPPLAEAARGFVTPVMCDSVTNVTRDIRVLLPEVGVASLGALIRAQLTVRCQSI